MLLLIFCNYSLNSNEWLVFALMFDNFEKSASIELSSIWIFPLNFELAINNYDSNYII
jgi:hypothetical protein